VLLRALGVRHLDMWILDVEGAELDVLKAMDFSAVEVDVLGVELDGANPAKDAACRELLDKAGFEATGEEFKPGQNVQRNCWFVRRGFVPEIEVLA
jgi:hypothetical protein